MIPALWRGELPNSDNWYVVDMLPGDRPLDELEVALLRVADDRSVNLHEQLERDTHGLLRVADLILPDTKSKLLLVIDQFEEVFTLVTDESERLHFLNLLHEAVTRDRSRVRVIVTLRADYYDRPLQYPDFGELIRSRVETILPLSAEELEHAVREPAGSVGVRFEDGLVSRIVSDVHYQPGALPLLQYALTELFERRDGCMLTQAAYQAIGGTGGALAHRADEIYLEQDEAGQELIRQIFLRLVTLGEGAEDTRRRVPRSELLAIAQNKAVVGSNELTDEIIDLYAASRLLSLDNDPATRTPTVEVAHEAILREWERLRTWLNVSREDIRQQRIVGQVAEAWQTNKRDTSYLLSGTRLEQVEKWHELTELALTPLEHEFIESSIVSRTTQQKREAERQVREIRLEQRSRNFLRGLVAVLTLATVLAVGLSLFAFDREAQARAANATSDANLILAQENFAFSESQRLAAEANLLMANESSGELAALLSIRALHSAYSPQADMALQRASRHDYGLNLLAIGKPVASVNYSPDGQYILTVDFDSSLKIWDSETASLIREFASYSSSNSGANAVFSPDSQQILYRPTTSENYALVIDVASGEQVIRLSGHNGEILAVAFSPDGRYVLTASRDSTARLWDAATGVEVMQFTGKHNGAINTVAFSPDGRTIATGGNDRTVWFWNVETGEALHSLTGFTNRLVSVAFSPDGLQLLTASSERIFRLWDIQSSTEIRQYTGHSDGLFQAVFSPDGQRIATASLDTTARIWDTETGAELHRINGHTSAVYTIAFSPDGQSLLTGSRDGTARTWDTNANNEYGILSGTVGVFFATAYSPDGRWLAAGTNNDLYMRDAVTNTVQWVSTSADAVLTTFFTPDSRYILVGYRNASTSLWDVATGDELYHLNAVGGLNGLVLSPDGTYFVANEADGIFARTTLTGERIRQISSLGVQNAIMSFAPDGQLIVIEGGNIHFIDINTGDETRLLVNESGVVSDISFSADGRYMFTSGIDTNARMWELSSGTVLETFAGHTNRIWHVIPSRDEQYLLTAGQEGTVRLWDIATGMELRRYIGEGAVQSTTFSPDEQMVLIGTTNGKLYMTPTFINDLIASVCSRILRDLTPDERVQYSIQDDMPTCPQFDSEAEG